MATASSREINHTSFHEKPAESDSALVKPSSSQGLEGPIPEQRTVSSGSDDVYPKQGQRRLALIFNHENFRSSKLKRTGTESDKVSLQKCFEKYNFDIEPLKDDMGKREIRKKLEEVSKRDLSNTDCLAVAVLTHGKHGGQLAAYDGWYKKQELIGAFKKCLSLTRKPKLFFIQECRGDETSINVRWPQTQADSTDSYVFSVPEEADVLVFYNTYEGKAYPEGGSLFIQELCSELTKNGEKDDLLSMLTHVNFNVAARVGPGRKKMPMIQSSLTRKFYLSNKSKLTEKDIATSIGSKLDETLVLLKQLNV